MSIKKQFQVQVKFLLNGSTGNESYLVEAKDLVEASHIGWSRLEEELIDLSAVSTWECGCCVSTEDRNFKLVEIDAVECPKS